MNTRHSLLISLLLTASLAACAAPPATVQPRVEPAEFALVAAEETSLAATVAALDATSTATPTQSPPSATPAPTNTPTPIPPTATITPAPTPDFAAWASQAKILLYEDLDLYQHAQEMRFAQRALENLGYNYESTETNSGMLLRRMREESWDLVIVASENKSATIGEFLAHFNQHVFQGGAMIWEAWYFDDVKNLGFNYALQACGLEVQGEYSDSMRNVLWVNPAHPLLNYPNAGFSIEDFRQFWKGDVGDLLALREGGTAEVIASTNGSDSQNIVLASCLDGRLIMQTFSSHDHKNDDMVALWENYIVNALQARYQALMQGRADRWAALRAASSDLEILAQGVWYLNSPSTVLSAAGIAAGNGEGNWEIASLIKERNPDVVLMSASYADNQQPEMLNQAKAMLEAGKVVVIRGGGDAQTQRNLEPILAACGLEVIGNYTVGQQRTETWLLPDHPILLYPSALEIPARKASAENLGFLLRKLPGSQAEAIGGVELEGEQGLFLTTCFEGRLVLLTLDTVSFYPVYTEWDRFRFYENMVYYALEKAAGLR